MSQTEKDTKRFISLGVDKDNISTTGNLKYNLITPENLNEQTNQLKKSISNRFVWIAGSTHSGEEEIILKAHKQYASRVVDVMICRHVCRYRYIFQSYFNAYNI